MPRWDQDDESRTFWMNVEEVAQSVRGWSPDKRAAAAIAVCPGTADEAHVVQGDATVTEGKQSQSG